ncbi:hypothetical protein, partial [Actinobacillus pleuropneumoniae]|uniref:hypothetical protein n=1 Tax=Actinobacillus pleuropneumoniae TaxID=715 RepID=UPI00227BD26F
MTTSTSGSSNSALFTRFFDEDMKQELSTMMDMVREMYEDGRKSNRVREHLNSMKEEKTVLARKTSPSKKGSGQKLWFRGTMQSKC